MFGKISYDEYIEMIEKFHGTASPGIIMGGFMINVAFKNKPSDVFFDVICETKTCLPDAVQLLTPCSVGNGWLKILDLGKFACVFYDKYTGDGMRVFLDIPKLDNYSEVKTWFLKLKKKDDQDTNLLIQQIIQAGEGLFGVQKVKVDEGFLKKKKMGKNTVCPICKESYPVSHGSVCRGCTETLPYSYLENEAELNKSDKLILNKTVVEDAVGKHLLHDITRVIHNKEKAVIFKKGHKISEADVLILRNIGKYNLYLEEENSKVVGYIHEDDAVLGFSEKLKGKNVEFNAVPNEGKINLTACEDGILVFDEDKLEKFNNCFGVICAGLPNYSVVKKSDKICGTRIIPLFISNQDYLKALSKIDTENIFNVHTFKKANVGIISTGSEVYEGLVKDEYANIMDKKLQEYGCVVTKKAIVPDSIVSISEKIKEMVQLGLDLVITTAGLSVDPNDVTYEAILTAGARDVIYSVPVLPGSMLLVGKIGETKIIGVPACGLFDKYFSFDLILPRILADLEITRNDFAKLGNGGFLKNKN